MNFMYFSIKYRYSIEKININFIYNRLFCCNHTCYSVCMFSVTSVSRYVTQASRYESRPSMFIRGLIPRNYPMPFRLSIHVETLTEIDSYFYLQVSLRSADTFTNSFGPDQARQNVGPDLNNNCLTVIIFLDDFFENVNFENKTEKTTISMHNYPARKELIYIIIRRFTFLPRLVILDNNRHI